MSTRVAWVGALVVFLLIGVFALRLQVIGVYHRAMFVVYPTAERAIAYADESFSSQNDSRYDLARAKFYYTRALGFRPSAYVHHQLARIEFLEGNFNSAMFFINRAIENSDTVYPNSYYIRGLIEGYMGNYSAAAKDYEQYVSSDTHNWAALNDYAWVLLKDQRYSDALKVVADALQYFPENAWLLNSAATTLYELGQYDQALALAQAAEEAALKVKESEWLVAYPGNDPGIAQKGLAEFRNALKENIHTIALALATSAVQ